MENDTTQMRARVRVRNNVSRCTGVNNGTEPEELIEGRRGSMAACIDPHDLGDATWNTRAAPRNIADATCQLAYGLAQRPTRLKPCSKM